MSTVCISFSHCLIVIHLYIIRLSFYMLTTFSVSTWNTKKMPWAMPVATLRSFRCFWMLCISWRLSASAAMTEMVDWIGQHPERQIRSLQGRQWYSNGVQPADAKNQPFKGKRKIRISSRAQKDTIMIQKEHTKGLWMPQQWQLRQDSICTH